SFSPPAGPVGTTVTITGAGLTQASKVTFNGTSAAFTVNSDAQVTATVPTGATTGKIGVTTKGGTATSTTTFTIP
ncbi:MAG: IPT/TIG domain-containing protein, partial [Candidatus Sulfotelmatobacter sp.]